MKSNPKKISQWISLIIMFASMCYLRLWYSILIFFAIGIVSALIFKNRSYCGYICPLGALSDMTGSNNNKHIKIPKYIRRVTEIAFWGYIFYNIIFYVNKPSVLWSKMFMFSVVIISVALILQIFFKNRTWCTSLCPVGLILAFFSNRNAKAPLINANRCTNCNLCTEVCPLDINSAPPKKTEIDAKLCLQCQKCIDACKNNAFTIKND